MSLYASIDSLMNACGKVSIRGRSDPFLKEYHNSGEAIAEALHELEINTTSNKYNSKNFSCVVLGAEMDRLSMLEDQLSSSLLAKGKKNKRSDATGEGDYDEEVEHQSPKEYTLGWLMDTKNISDNRDVISFMKKQLDHKRCILVEDNLGLQSLQSLHCLEAISKISITQLQRAGVTPDARSTFIENALQLNPSNGKKLAEEAEKQAALDMMGSRSKFLTFSSLHDACFGKHCEVLLKITDVHEEELSKQYMKCAGSILFILRELSTYTTDVEEEAEAEAEAEKTRQAEEERVMLEKQTYTRTLSGSKRLLVQETEGGRSRNNKRSSHRNFKQSGGTIRLDQLPKLKSNQKEKLDNYVFNMISEVERMVMDRYYDILINNHILQPDGAGIYDLKISIPQIISLLLDTVIKKRDEEALFNPLQFLKDIDDLIYEILSKVRRRLIHLQNKVIRYYSIYFVDNDDDEYQILLMTILSDENDFLINILDPLESFNSHYIKIIIWLLKYLLDDPLNNSDDSNTCEIPIKEVGFNFKNIHDILSSLPTGIFSAFLSHQMEMLDSFEKQIKMLYPNDKQILFKNIILLVLISNANCTFGYDNGFGGALNMVEMMIAKQISGSNEDDAAPQALIGDEDEDEGGGGYYDEVLVPKLQQLLSELIPSSFPDYIRSKLDELKQFVDVKILHRTSNDDVIKHLHSIRLILTALVKYTTEKIQHIKKRLVALKLPKIAHLEPASLDDVNYRVTTDLQKNEEILKLINDIIKNIYQYSPKLERSKKIQIAIQMMEKTPIDDDKLESSSSAFSVQTLLFNPNKNSVALNSEYADNAQFSFGVIFGSFMASTSVYKNILYRSQYRSINMIPTLNDKITMEIERNYLHIINKDKQLLQYKILERKCSLVFEVFNYIVIELDKKRFQFQHRPYLMKTFTGVLTEPGLAAGYPHEGQRTSEYRFSDPRKILVQDVRSGGKKISKQNKKYTRKIKKSRSSSQKLNSRRKYKRKTSSKQSRKRIYEKSSNSKQRRTRKIRK
jgi:hypothetical protein